MTILDVKPQLEKLQKLIACDRKLLFTAASYVLILATFFNLNLFKSPFIGVVISFMYFLINSTFLGYAFFMDEDAFLRLMHGFLLVIAFLGLTAWIALIVYNLDNVRVALVLFVVATFASLANKGMRH